jgi:sugar phosphate isomerase/epimerase
MAKLSAFADEATYEFAGQIDFIVRQGVNYIEPRFFDGHKNIMNLTDYQLREAKKMLDDNNIGVSAIGSPVGKVKLDEPFENHLEKFKHAVELAEFFDTKNIRMFSYYAPDGKNIFDYHDEVVERMLKKIELLKDIDIVMVLENEADIYGQSPERAVKLVEAVGSPKLRLCYDPANFVVGFGITDNVQSCWPIMKPYVSHIHIKDWKVGDEIGSMPGQGDGQIKLLLKELADMNYVGFITVEPHLQEGGQFGGVTGPELFAQAINETKKIAQEVGLLIE